MDYPLSTALEAAARRRRARILAGLLARAARFIVSEPRHAARPHLARQG